MYVYIYIYLAPSYFQLNSKVTCIKARPCHVLGDFQTTSGSFGIQAFDMRVKNLANTNVMHWAGNDAPAGCPEIEKGRGQFPQ